MEVSKKKISAIFAAGVTTGASISALLLTMPDEKSAPLPAPAKVLRQDQKSLPVSATKSYEAEVTGIAGENVLHVRVHTWVAQFAMASVCIRGKTPSPKPCHYEAEVTDTAGNEISRFRKDDRILLRNLAPAEGEIAAHPVTSSIPAIRPRQDTVAGPLPARVTKLVDGDTVQVLVQTFPDHYLLTDIRIGEIDTPEKRSKCPDEAAKLRERKKAEEASEATRALIEGREVLLYDVRFEKYGGRVLGDVRTGNGVSAAQNLIDKGLAKPYNGGAKASWCGLK